MAFTYKILGQSLPTANTATTLYTVPSNTQALVSTVTVCNQSATSAKFRIAIRPGGATLVVAHYINYDTVVAGNDTISVSLAMTLGAGDVITVVSDSGAVSFNAFGSEVA